MSKYAKSHYEDMARILREVRECWPEGVPAFLQARMALGSVEDRMTALFKEDNPSWFQPEKFTRAARPSSGPPPALDFGEPGTSQVRRPRS